MDSDNNSNHTLPTIGDDSDSGQTPNPVPAIQSDQVMSDGVQPLAQADDYSGSLKAEDVDLIEKAWVEKAKAIVQSTEGDPFNQNKQLSKVKAEYIKKRYDKDIRVGE